METRKNESLDIVIFLTSLLILFNTTIFSFIYIYLEDKGTWFRKKLEF
jgi:hypothetical protein